MNNESNNLNNTMTSIPVAGTTPVSPSTAPTASAIPEIGAAPTPQIVDPTAIASAIPEMNATPVTPQIVNDPTADFKNSVNTSTISTNTNGPRITDTSVKTNETTPPTATQSEKKETYKDKMRQAEENYKAPSKYRMFLLVCFFIFVLLFIIFLPEIETFMSESPLWQNNNQQATTEITSGKLVCTYSTSTTNLDKSYVRIFYFSDNKVNSVEFETTTKGDVTEDETTLNELNNSCNIIKEVLSSSDGVSVSCEYTEGKLIEKETFDLNTYDYETAKAAFTEAGADIIKYDAGTDIDTIKTNMLQGGFTCDKKS